MASKNVFTISPLSPFADTLAAGLLKRHENSPEELAKTVVFLPTRRACKTLHEAFLRQSGGKPLLLPRLIPFGSIENDEAQPLLSLTDETAAEIPPAISPLRRRLLLMRLVKQKQPENLSAEKALQLADALAEFLDESYIESMPLERLKDLVPDEFAAHWQETLAFLEIITAMWPEILKEEGVIDATDRQVRLFSAQADCWRRTPPDFPVIAAGSTGSQPATAELLDAVASMPGGMVILPGLDMLTDDESFVLLEPSHPQYNLKHLLDRMGITRRDVRLFGETAAPERTERLRLITEAMRPAATTDAWRTAEKFTPEALSGVRRIDCVSVQEEALAIALILRETLETPGKTAALITPDRALGRRVVAEMNRWGIVMDDSAGTNLTLTPLGAFILLLGEAALSNLAPYELLACLKHPLAAGGTDYARFRAQVRRLEKSILRGKRPGDGLDGLKKAVEKENAALKETVEVLESCLGAFTSLMQEGTQYCFETFLESHLAAAEALAQSADRTGAERLWTGEAGEAAAAFLTELKQQSELMAPLDAAEYLSVLSALFKGISVRPKYGMHPRLDILGTMEARLIQPDVLVLGGLNEGTWPKSANADPWMSRPMREECGLSSPERKIALSAHDFVQAFCAPNVILTRSAKDGGTPTVPSRWLMRLDAVLAASDLSWEKGSWQYWAQKTDEPAAVLSFLPPKPTPPVAVRPRRLSVTKIETWMRDPYSIYARYILGLEPLADIDEELNIADYGNILHKTVETFCSRHPSRLPPDAGKEILQIGREMLDTMNFSVTAAAFWKPRLETALEWFMEQQENRTPDIREILCEQEGSLTLQTAGGAFRLRCFADRIDVMKDGTVTLIDYKTGEVPAEKSVLAGYSPQLPLEVAILLNGGFERVGKKTVSAMEYWRLRGKQDKGFIRRLKADAAELSEESLERLKDLIETYEKPETPYLATPDVSVSLKYNDYDHLARFAEWATLDDNGETEEG